MKREREMKNNSTPHPPLEKQAELQKFEQTKAYQAELESQLNEENQKRQELYEEFLKEKELVDAIVTRIYEEDRKEAEQAMMKKQITRREFEEYMAHRQAWRQQELEAIEKENMVIRQ